MEGQQIGQYRIERTLGRGGFGVVYVGIDVRLERRAAIKQLLPELSSNREIVERFFNEAKAAAGISHPGIVEIYDVGWHTDGSAYFAMKLLDGDSLARRIRATGPMPVLEATTIARQVAAALTAAHKNGIVHRDLKPDNIVLVPDEEVAFGARATVLDFGIAKLFGDKPASHKTRTGMMMGTPAYMSPEQCRGAGEVDHRTDIYALGCILFEMLAGRPPFVSEGAGEILGMHQFVEPPEIRSLRADLPDELAAVIGRALAKRPADRQQTMAELGAALQPFSTPSTSATHTAQLPSASATGPLALAPTKVSATPAHAPTVASLPPSPPTSPPAPSTYSGARGELAAVVPARRRTWPYAIAAVVAIAVGVVLVVASSSPSSNAPADGAAALAPPEAAPAKVVEPDLVGKARAELAARKWRDAIATAAQITASGQHGREGEEITNRAFEESRYEDADRELTAAIGRDDALAVKVAFAKLPQRSTYFADAKARYDGYVAAFVAKGKQQARDLASRHRCDELAKLGPKLAQTFPEAAGVAAGIACTPRKDAGEGEGQIGGVEVEPAPREMSVEDALAAASRAAASGNYATARVMANKVLRADPSNARAHTVMMLVACRTRDRLLAHRHYSKLSDSNKAALRQVCLSQGITVD